MTHIVTRLCLRDTACIEVCPVECMILGKPEEEWPWLYIDPDTCIDCGACVPECPYEAIFPEEEVEDEWVADDRHEHNGASGVWIAMKAEDMAGEPLVEKEIDGHVVNVLNAVFIAEGTEMDLMEDIEPNYDFCTDGVGPGYDAEDM